MIPGATPRFPRASLAMHPRFPMLTVATWQYRSIHCIARSASSLVNAVSSAPRVSSSPVVFILLTSASSPSLLSSSAPAGAASSTAAAEFDRFFATHAAGLSSRERRRWSSPDEPISSSASSSLANSRSTTPDSRRSRSCARQFRTTSKEAKSNDTNAPRAFAAFIAALASSGRYRVYPSTCRSRAPASASSSGKSAAPM
mmetsp:Transcript_13618/g.22270  ORF Transcript_13618/g.22270 Transcript_13618/m.22270 type:complete len:200 (+) Transcript_13618:344-943(+)